MAYKAPSRKEAKKIQKFLAKDERALLVTSIGTRYFWINFAMLLPFAFLIIGIPKLSQLLRMKQSFTYALTNKRFVIVRGIFSRKIVTAPLAAITHVTIEQSFAQRYIFNTGHLVVITAGFDQREIVIENIGDPVGFKIMIEELTDKLDDTEDDASQIRALK